jgi:hypothetical protein
VGLVGWLRQPAVLSCPHAEEPRSAGELTHRAHPCVRCAASRSMRALPMPVLILRDARTRVRVRGKYLACALLRTRTNRACHHLTMSNSHSCSFPRRVFAPGLCLFASLTRIEGGGAPRDVRVQRTRAACTHASKTRVNALMTWHARRLARRLASHDAGRSPLGAPPRRFGLRAALLSPAFAPDRSQRAPRTQVVVPGRRGPEPPGASGYEPLPQDATPHFAFRIVSRTRPQ